MNKNLKSLMSLSPLALREVFQCLSGTEIRHLLREFSDGSQAPQEPQAPESPVISIIDEELLKRDYPFYVPDDLGTIYYSGDLSEYVVTLDVTPYGADFKEAHRANRTGRYRDVISYTIEGGFALTADEAARWLSENEDALYALQQSIDGFEYDEMADAEICDLIDVLEKSLLHKDINLDNYVKSVNLSDIFPRFTEMSPEDLSDALSDLSGEPYMTKDEAIDFFDMRLQEDL